MAFNLARNVPVTRLMARRNLCIG